MFKWCFPTLPYKFQSPLDSPILHASNQAHHELTHLNKLALIGFHRFLAPECVLSLYLNSEDVIENCRGKNGVSAVYEDKEVRSGNLIRLPIDFGSMMVGLDTKSCDVDQGMNCVRNNGRLIFRRSCEHTLLGSRDVLIPDPFNQSFVSIERHTRMHYINTGRRIKCIGVKYWDSRYRK